MKRVPLIKQLCLLACLASLLSAADLSTYHGFQLGMSLNATVRHSGMDLSDHSTGWSAINRSTSLEFQKQIDGMDVLLHD
jgi:hypothetical protein